MVKRWIIYTFLLVVVFLLTTSQAPIRPSVRPYVFVSVLCYSVRQSVIRLYIYYQNVKLINRAYLY